MIKVNKGEIVAVGRKSAVMAELSVLIDSMAEKDYEGTLIAIILGLKDHNDAVESLCDKLDDFLEDKD